MYRIKPEELYILAMEKAEAFSTAKYVPRALNTSKHNEDPS